MCFLKYGLIDATTVVEEVAVISKPNKQLEYIDEVFTTHKWIEPNETIDDVKILRIQAGTSVAIQIEQEIIGAQKWSASTAFPLTPEITNAKFTSEDEQEDVDEIEEATAVVNTKLAQAKRSRKSLPEDKKTEISALIDRAESLLIQLNSTSSADKKLLKQSWELEQEFNKYLS